MSETENKRSSLPKKIILGLVTLVAALAVIGTLASLFLLKPIVTSQISKRTGFAVKAEKISLNPFTATATIDGLVLSNPAAEFKTPGFVDLKALRAEIKLTSLLWGDQLVVNSATLDLPSVTLVRREKADSNAALFAQRLAGETTSAEQPKPDTQPAKPFKFLIKKFDINLGKVVIANETAAGEITSKDYAVNYKHSYENITDPKQFMTVDLAKSLLGVGSQLTDLIPGKFGDSVNSVLKGGIQALDNPAAAGAVQNLLNQLAPKK